MKSRVVVGLLGTKLDVAPRGERWASWRPSVAMCQHEDFVVDRFELLYERRSEPLMKEVVKDIQAVSPETDVRPHEISLSDPWDFEVVYAQLHEFTRNYSFNTEEEDYLVHITTGTHVAQICLFLLTESRHLPGVLLQTSPPRRRAKSTQGYYRIIDLDLSRYDELASRFQQEHREGHEFLKSGIETRNVQFNQLIERIEQVSLASRSPILLTGPTGAGKSQLARRIYQLKRHREQVNGELVEVNCATIRGEQAMPTLFGHTKGAFTGAMVRRDGLLKAADGGVLFLDEIGELGLDEQAMLLRAIEEKTFLPVGSDSATTSDFQLIAGTNRNLLTQVANGNFREDLLARINLWSFEIPGLDQRRDDIEPNIEFELAQFARTSGRKATLNKEASTRFLEFALNVRTPWKANFRDLNAAITRMATLSKSGRISVADVNEEIERLNLSWNSDASGDANANRLTGQLKEVLGDEKLSQIDRFDQAQLAEVVFVCRQSQSLSAAGRKLYQVSRLAKQKPNDADRLRKYLAKFELQWSDIHKSTS